MTETNKQLPDPQTGGQYVRNADGSLTQVGKTEEAASISETAASPAAPAEALAPAPASPDHDQE